MRDPKRIKPFCDRLAELWETRCPDWRFTQLIENVFMFKDNPATFYLEDNWSLQLLEEFFEE